MVATPYGEARRLAYFRLICEQSEKSLPCDILFLVDQIVTEAKKMHSSLQRYKRTTGRMETRNVCYNYLRFASWLRLLRIEGKVVSKNANTVLFSTVEPGNGFDLSIDEKIAYFVHVWSRVPKLSDVLQMLSTSRALASGELQSLQITEHSAETYLEWLVDLDLANQTRRDYGAFYLSPTGNEIKTKGNSFKNACCAYVSCVLGQRVEPTSNVSKEYVWQEVVRLTRILSSHIGSPVDPKLVAVLPVLLHLQLSLMKAKHSFMTREELITLAKRSIDPHKAIFTWDSAYNTGFIKFR